MVTINQPIFRRVFLVFLRKQTYLNITYLGTSVILGFAYYLILQVGLALSWSFIFPTLPLLASQSLTLPEQIRAAAVILVGLLILPALVIVLLLPVLPEQVLANTLLREKIALEMRIWSKDSFLLRPWRLFSEPSPWKRLLFIILRIPLGVVSFFALFSLLIPAVALFGMPLAHLVGFQNLIIGAWRMDTMEKAAAAFFAGLLLVPLALHCINWLAALAGWLARKLLLA